MAKKKFLGCLVLAIAFVALFPVAHWVKVKIEHSGSSSRVKRSVQSNILKTPAAAKNQDDAGLTPRQWLLVAKIACTVFIVSLLAGYMLGRARSPQFDDPTRSPLYIREYLAEHAITEQWSPFSSSGKCTKVSNHGRITAIGPALIYRFTCGATVFVYDAGLNAISKEPAKPQEGENRVRTPRNNLKFSEAVALIVGGAGSYSAASTASTIGDLAANQNVSMKVRAAIVAGAGCISGLVLGFKLGYKDKPKCGEQLFQTLLNDPVFWRGVAEDHVRAFYWRFHEHDQRLYDVTGMIGNKVVLVAGTRVTLWDHNSYQYGGKLGDFDAQLLTQMLLDAGEMQFVQTLKSKGTYLIKLRQG